MHGPVAPRFLTSFMPIGAVDRMVLATGHGLSPLISEVKSLFSLKIVSLITLGAERQPMGLLTHGREADMSAAIILSTIRGREIMGLKQAGGCEAVGRWRVTTIRSITRSLETLARLEGEALLSMTILMSDRWRPCVWLGIA